MFTMTFKMSITSLLNKWPYIAVKFSQDDTKITTVKAFAAVRKMSNWNNLTFSLRFYYIRGTVIVGWIGSMKPVNFQKRILKPVNFGIILLKFDILILTLGYFNVSQRFSTQEMKILTLPLYSSTMYVIMTFNWWVPNLF